MLYKTDLRYRLISDENITLDSEIAVKIHGALMNAIDSRLAEFLHTSKLHPFSLYCIEQNGGIFVRLCSLTDETSELCDVLTQLQTLEFYGCNTRAELFGCELYDPVSLSDAASAISDNICINLITPAMYRSKGHSLNTPEPEKYFYSVICKMNEFENLSINYDDFISCWKSSDIVDYSYRSTRYKITGWKFPGMTGHIKLHMPKNRKQSLLLKKVIAYAEYSGLGAKTGQGMGAISIQ